MRTSLLSRSVIAVASLAIGSVGMVVPAVAAVPVGVDRDAVLSLAHDLHAYAGPEDARPETLNRTVELLISRACAFETSGDTEIITIDAEPFMAGAADGVVITARLREESADTATTRRWCTFGAIASTDAAFALSGYVAISVMTDDRTPPRLTAAAQTTAGEILSGAVFVTAPIITNASVDITSSKLTASGNATRSIKVTTPHKVTTPKSKSAKKAAKKKYDKKLKTAKAKFEKAGKSAKAKKAYRTAKAAAKKAYKKAIVTVKTVKKTTVRTENRPFNVNVTARSANR